MNPFQFINRKWIIAIFWPLQGPQCSQAARYARYALLPALWPDDPLMMGTWISLRPFHAQDLQCFLDAKQQEYEVLICLLNVSIHLFNSLFVYIYIL